MKPGCRMSPCVVAIALLLIRLAPAFCLLLHRHLVIVDLARPKHCLPLNVHILRSQSPQRHR